MERRSRPRQPVDIVMLCRIPATPYRVRMVDATRDGCRLSMRRIALVGGQSITLEIDADTHIPGTVIWRTAIEAGIRFEERLPVAIARMLGIAVSEADLETEARETAHALEEFAPARRSAA